MPLDGDQPTGSPFGQEQVEAAKRIACSLARRYSLNVSDADEFMAEAPGLIFERIEHCDPQRTFEAWAYVVLRNLLFDDLRKKTRQQRNLQALKVELSQVEIPAFVDELDLTTPFSERDLKCLDGHSPRPRLVALCIRGLWQKVPPARQQKWLLEAKVEVNPLADADFQAAGLHERFKWLAQQTSMSYAAVSMAYSRGVKRLRELQFVQTCLKG